MIEPDWSRLTVVPEKAKAYASDLFFRECWADVAEILGPDPAGALASLAVMNFKPDAIVGRRMTMALDYAVGEGFVPIAATPRRFTRHSMREVWRYDWHIYPVDRLAFSTVWYTANDVLLLVFEDRAREGSLPATTRLSELKGSALPEKRTARQMRSVLRPASRILNFVHVAEEPADIVRELGIFFERDERRAFLRQVAASRGVDHYAQAAAEIAQLEAAYPPHDLDFEASLRRTAARAPEAAARLRSKPVVGWDELCAMLDPESVDRWDFIVIASNVIPFEREVPALIPAADAKQWTFRDRAEHRGLARGAEVLRLPENDDIRMLEHEVGSPRAWTRDNVDASHWMVDLEADARAEVMELVSKMRESPLPLLLRTPDSFRLDACRETMARVKARLLDGMGLAVVGPLPMDEMTAEEATAVYWILGQFLANPVATKWDGTMLYHVTDTGRAFGYGVRGSATNVELSFHTDNAFGVALPDYVGLLCIQPAMSGGISRFCSLYTVHDEMLRREPRLLRRLYEPAYYDRQAEHAPSAPKVMSAALFRYDGQRLYARLTPNLIRRGYEMVGEPMEDVLTEALECLEETVRREEYSVEFTIARGQLQYVQNHWCAHFRSAFIDSDDPARKRSLFRVWYREQGGRGYDG